MGSARTGRRGRAVISSAASGSRSLFSAVVRFLSYIDRRIRLEGWEIELRLKSVGRALEERPQ